MVPSISTSASAPNKKRMRPGAASRNAPFAPLGFVVFPKQPKEQHPED